MHPVPVTLRSRTPDVPLFETHGYVPTLDSPLAVTRFALYDKLAEQWAQDESDPGYMITHRPTGFYLGTGLAEGLAEAGAVVWDTLPEAWAVLLRCDPSFPAWSIADKDEAARVACRTKFKWANSK